MAVRRMSIPPGMYPIVEIAAGMANIPAPNIVFNKVMLLIVEHRLS